MNNYDLVDFYDQNISKTFCFCSAYIYPAEVNLLLIHTNKRNKHPDGQDLNLNGFSARATMSTHHNLLNISTRNSATLAKKKRDAKLFPKSLFIVKFPPTSFSISSADTLNRRHFDMSQKIKKNTKITFSSLKWSAAADSSK